MDRFTEYAWAQLKDHWGSAYVFSHDATQDLPFRADRRDGLGSLSAREPDELHQLVVRDYTARRVSREVAP
ncbi:MAG: hypothetical protein WAK76_21665 [Trebonia sp.]